MKKEPSGYDYEDYCCHYLKKNGFKKITQTPRSKDHGIDIIAKRHRKTYAFQCKYYSGKIGNHAIQEAYSGCSYYECDIPVVITNSTFTPNAITEADTLGVILMDNVEIKKNLSFFPIMLTFAITALLIWHFVLPSNFKIDIYEYIYEKYSSGNTALYFSAIVVLVALTTGITAIHFIKQERKKRTD